MDFSNAFTSCAGILDLGSSLLPAQQKRSIGLRPSFPAHVRWGEH
jgi:hypothetical protein